MRKHSFKLWGLLLLAVVFMVSVGGCGGGSDGDSSATLSKPVAFVGVSDKIDSLPDGWQQKVTDAIIDSGSAAQVVFLHSTSVQQALDAGLKEVYGQGAAVVLVEPTEDSLNALSSAVGHFQAVPVGGENDPAYTIYAFISNGSGEHTYVIGKAGEKPEAPLPDPIEVPADVNPPAAGEEGEVPEYPEPASPPEADRMEHFLEWLGNSGPKAMAGRLARVKEGALADTNDVLALVKAQTVTFNNNMTAYYNVSGFQPSSHYTDTYFIYAIYDSTNKYDYYIFDQEQILVNGPMYKGFWTNSDWGSYTHVMGQYLYDFYTDHYLQDSGGNYLSIDQHNIIQPQPQVTTGSSSYSTSQSYTIGGSLGFAGMGGTGSVTGSMTYSQSRTTSIPDITVLNQAGQIYTDGANNARWTYQVGNLTHPVNNYTIFYPHDSTIEPNPPAIAVNTATFYNNWIWRVVKPAANARYQVLCRSRPRFAFCKCRAGYYDDPAYSYYDNMTNGDIPYDSSSNRTTINLIAPPRS